MSFGGREPIFLPSLPTIICEQQPTACSSLTDTAGFLNKRAQKICEKS